jgi:hypothetical protein
MAVQRTKEPSGRSRLHPQLTAVRLPGGLSCLSPFTIVGALTVGMWGIVGLILPGQAVQSLGENTAIAHSGTTDAMTTALGTPALSLQAQVVAPTKEPPNVLPLTQPAPSVAWLIVMPAIPIVGGALIYLRRRFLSSEAPEDR